MDAPTLPPNDRLQIQRRQLLKAMSIIEACRLGTDSKLLPINGGDEPDLEGALVAAHELLDGVAEALHAIEQGVSSSETYGA